MQRVPEAPTGTEPDLFELFSEYSGIGVREIKWAAAHYPTVNARHWQECTGETWEERALQFYDLANGYVFDLLHGNRSKDFLINKYRSFGHWEWFLQSGPEVLEFGGGLGLACSIFRDLGRQVTYLDVPSAASEFARWYFDRTGQQDIEFLITPVERLELPPHRQWDHVWSDAVIEHLTDPVGTVDRLARAVRPGGLLHLIIDAHSVGPEFPMHRDVYVDELLQGSSTLANMEHLLHEGDEHNVFRQPS